MRVQICEYLGRTRLLARAHTNTRGSHNHMAAIRQQLLIDVSDGRMRNYLPPQSCLCARTRSLLLLLLLLLQLQDIRALGISQVKPRLRPVRSKQGRFLGTESAPAGANAKLSRKFVCFTLCPSRSSEVKKKKEEEERERNTGCEQTC